MPSSTSLMPTSLASQTSTQIDLFAVQTQTAAVGDEDRLVVKRIVKLLNALVGAAGRRVDLGRTFHRERLMRTLVVELLDKGVELGLLLKQVGAGGTGGLLFQGQMHALVTAVLLRMTGADAFYADAEPQPPNGKSGQIL